VTKILVDIAATQHQLQDHLRDKTRPAGALARLASGRYYYYYKYDCGRHHHGDHQQQQPFISH